MMLEMFSFLTSPRCGRWVIYQETCQRLRKTGAADSSGCALITIDHLVHERRRIMSYENQAGTSRGGSLPHLWC